MLPKLDRSVTLPQLLKKNAVCAFGFVPLSRFFELSKSHFLSSRTLTAVGLPFNTTQFSSVIFPVF